MCVYTCIQTFATYLYTFSINCCNSPITSCAIVSLWALAFRTLIVFRHICVCVCLCIYTFVLCASARTYTYIDIFIHTHTWMCLCTNLCFFGANTLVCVSVVCRCTYIHVFMWNWHGDLRQHKQIQTYMQYISRVHMVTRKCACKYVYLLCLAWQSRDLSGQMWCFPQKYDISWWIR